jgi:putative ABC transport system permease protein
VKPILGMAARSAWNRRFSLALVVVSIALSTFLLLGMERVRKDMRTHFAAAVSGTDLIVGARSGSVQLLLYSVFRIGAASNNIRWSSAEALARHPQVAWTVPISLGDSHRGFAVVGTSADYFRHFRYGDRAALALAEGRPFAQRFEAVLGADVAGQLRYKPGERIVLAHGDGALEENDHAANPVVVVGVLARTGTPVDRSVHIDLETMDALHEAPAGFGAAADPPPAPSQVRGSTRTITALLVGLKSRAAVFSLQRWVADFRAEPLQAVLPGVALDELWTLVGIAEKSLLAMGAMVFVVGLAGMVAVILAGLDERRRELAILRAVGAAPRHVMALLALEAALITFGGVVLGVIATYGATVLLAGWAQSQFGVALRLEPPAAGEWTVVAAMLAAGLVAGLLPGLRAYRLSLADGLSPRI